MSSHTHESLVDGILESYPVKTGKFSKETRKAWPDFWSEYQGVRMPVVPDAHTFIGPLAVLFEASVTYGMERKLDNYGVLAHMVDDAPTCHFVVVEVNKLGSIVWPLQEIWMASLPVKTPIRYVAPCEWSYQADALLSRAVNDAPWLGDLFGRSFCAVASEAA